MRVRAALAVLLSCLLAGCGNGYFVGLGVGIGSSFDDLSFLVWSGNASSERVVDANNEAFAFYADNGCLYNFQTERENPSFCLAPGQDTALFGTFLIRIGNVRSSTGTCIAAFLDERTGNLIDIELDQRGNEVVIVTSQHPVLCTS